MLQKRGIVAREKSPLLAILFKMFEIDYAFS